MQKRHLFLGLLMLTAVGCTTRSQVKKTLSKNPDILFDVLAENPEKFMAMARKAREDESRIIEERKIEDGFANPKQPVIDPARAILGPSDAPILIVEYSDFQCPYCQGAVERIKTVEKKYPGQVRFIFKHLPLSFHEQALPSAQMFEAIALQSSEKAYQFHDALYENQDKLKDEKEKLLLDLAKKVGADVERAKADMKSETVKKRIDDDQAEAAKFEFSGTPSFLINGVSLSGLQPEETFNKIIDRLLKQKNN